MTGIKIMTVKVLIACFMIFVLNGKYLQGKINANRSDSEKQNENYNNKIEDLDERVNSMLKLANENKIYLEEISKYINSQNDQNEQDERINKIEQSTTLLRKSLEDLKGQLYIDQKNYNAAFNEISGNFDRYNHILDSNFKTWMRIGFGPAMGQLLGFNAVGYSSSILLSISKTEINFISFRLGHSFMRLEDNKKQIDLYTVNIGLAPERKIITYNNFTITAGLVFDVYMPAKAKYSTGSSEYKNEEYTDSFTTFSPRIGITSKVKYPVNIAENRLDLFIACEWGAFFGGVGTESAYIKTTTIDNIGNLTLGGSLCF